MSETSVQKLFETFNDPSILFDNGRMFKVFVDNMQWLDLLDRKREVTSTFRHKLPICMTPIIDL